MPPFLERLIFGGVRGVSRYVSMRIHGTSAQVQPDSPPDIPEKFLSIERISTGTLLSSNYPANMSVHFAIPTPLTVERTESFLGFAIRPGAPAPTAPVFKGTSVRVVRIEIYLDASAGDARFGTFMAMDGNRNIFQRNMDALDVLIPTSHEYFEEPGGRYGCDLNRRVYTGLGVTFEMGFTRSSIGYPEHSEILLVGAKAIFLLS
jgi:hypothetical protein